jgi:4-diphosphocytidyl-2-C-methyl-D-erythritol kinase
MRVDEWKPGVGGNDLEIVAASRFPPVVEALRWLSAFGDARMTGSGACVFAAFAEKGEAETVLGQLPAGQQGWVARGLDCHPLLGLAE